MPELPEVETLCRQLKPVAAGGVLKGVEILDHKIKPWPDLVPCSIELVARHGKALQFHLAGGQILELHLRMTGLLRWREVRSGTLSHTRVIFSLDKGYIYLIDVRRFATINLLNPKLPTGVDAPYDLLAGVNAGQLEMAARRKKSPVKVFMLDQSVLPGMGNIYACEILHLAGINPSRPASQLVISEWEKIGRTIPVVLNRAVECRGTTVSDWRDLFGHPGEYQHQLRVYAREGLSCSRCEGQIKRIKLGGRGTYYCPKCQQ